MSQSRDVVLFYTTNSPKSQTCIHTIKERQIPIKTICLDSKDIRHRAMHAKNLQIRHVPSLLVVGENGNVKLFVGLTKVLNSLNDIFNSKPIKQQPESICEIEGTLLDEHDFTALSSDEIPMFDVTPKKKKKKKKKVNTNGPVELVMLDDEPLQDMTPNGKTLKPQGEVDVMKLASQMQKQREESEIFGSQ